MVVIYLGSIIENVHAFVRCQKCLAILITKKTENSLTPHAISTVLHFQFILLHLSLPPSVFF